MNNILAAGSGGAAAGAVFLFLLIAISCLAVYLIPGIVASYRHVPNVGSVWAVNILFGWSLLGWGIAMAMACRSHYRPLMLPPPGPYERLMYPPPPPEPPYDR